MTRTDMPAPNVVSPHVPTQQVAIGDVVVELRVDEALAPTVLRAFAGRTHHDAEVDALEIPPRPYWLRAFIRALRAYRSIRPTALGQRCVYDPSCSRYGELAYRKLGFARGTIALVRRLRRCRPGLGGSDLP